MRFSTLRYSVVVACLISVVANCACCRRSWGGELDEPSTAARWWAFQPLDRVAPPRDGDSEWARSDIDRFVAAQLARRALQPAPPAGRRAWIRRVTFDLIGLPPTPAEVREYLADDAPGADDRLIDRLLASPAYGQRWGRHWLDVARYADYHDGNADTRSDRCEPLEAWRYRDWVVNSLNHDLPFDRFAFLQIAGDLVSDPGGSELYADGIVATTFLANGVWDRDDADKQKIVSDMVDDQIDTVGKAFLGLTIGCARCHDHKYDPITIEDYYALAGIFYSTRILKELGTKGGQYLLDRRPLVPAAYVTRYENQLAELQRGEEQLAAGQESSGPPQDQVRAEQELAGLRARMLPPPPVATAVQEGGTPGGLFPAIQDVPIHIRGSYRRLGPVVPRRLPAFFAGRDQPRIDSGSGRRELAAWVSSRDNPLTPRVIANRIWQGHFGAGLVATPNNFGLRAEPPSHPALLDWLAVTLREDGWSIKRLHRRIVLSAVYRQSSVAVAGNRDPQNRWLSRYLSRRIESEAIRDAMLSVAGQLDARAGGPALAGVANRRRSLYVQTARWDQNTYATLFDAANSDVSTGRRTASTVAPQSLFLMNSAFVHQQAERLAERTLQEYGADQDRIEFAYLLAFARPPRADEVRLLQNLLDAGRGSSSSAEIWTDIAHLLLCSNEFVYVD